MVLAPTFSPLLFSYHFPCCSIAEDIYFLLLYVQYLYPTFPAIVSKVAYIKKKEYVCFNIHKYNILEHLLTRKQPTENSQGPPQTFSLAFK